MPTKNITKPKRKQGRPNALTEEVQNKILSAIRAGSYINVACKAAGICRASFYSWLEAGKDDPSANYEAAPLYRKFRHEVELAEAEAEIRLLVQAQKGGPTGTAAMMVMSRRWKERWSERSQHEITGRDGGPVEVVDARQKLADRITNLANTAKASAGDPVLN